MKRLTAGLIVLPMLLAGPARTEPTPVVYVFDEAFPPFSFVQAGAPAGFELEVLARVLASDGRKLDAKPMHWDAAQAALREGKADVTSGMAKTPEREQVFLFAETPTYVLNIVNWAPDSSPITGPGDLKGRVVATERGSLYQKLLEERGGMTLKLYETEPEALAAMVNRKAEAWAGSNPTARYFAKQLGYRGIEPKAEPLLVSPIYYVFAAGRGALRDKVSDGLEAFKKSAGYLELKAKWSVD